MGIFQQLRNGRPFRTILVDSLEGLYGTQDLPQSAATIRKHFRVLFLPATTSAPSGCAFDFRHIA